MTFINRHTTVGELIDLLRADRKKNQKTISIHSKAEGDKLPKNICLLLTDDEATHEKMNKLFMEF